LSTNSTKPGNNKKNLFAFLWVCFKDCPEFARGASEQKEKKTLKTPQTTSNNKEPSLILILNCLSEYMPFTVQLYKLK
jgi:hypothetical protein